MIAAPPGRWAPGSSSSSHIHDNEHHGIMAQATVEALPVTCQHAPHAYLCSGPCESGRAHGFSEEGADDHMQHLTIMRPEFTSDMVWTTDALIGMQQCEKWNIPALVHLACMPKHSYTTLCHTVHGSLIPQGHDLFLRRLDPWLALLLVFFGASASPHALCEKRAKPRWRHCPSNPPPPPGVGLRALQARAHAWPRTPWYHGGCNCGGPPCNMAARPPCIPLLSAMRLWPGPWSLPRRGLMITCKTKR